MKRAVPVFGLLLLSLTLVFIHVDAGADRTGPTDAIGGPAKSTVQTGWWMGIPSSLGTLYEAALIAGELPQGNTALMVVNQPEILKSKGFTGIQQGTKIQVTLISETRAKVKVLPDGPEKEIAVK